jgi:predicted HD phosphohydrolase
VAVEGDDARAVADAAEQVAHAVDHDLVVAQLLHGLGHELDHVALLTAQGGNAHDVLEEVRQRVFALLGFFVQFRTHCVFLLRSAPRLQVLQ